MTGLLNRQAFYVSLSAMFERPQLLKVGAIKAPIFELVISMMEDIREADSATSLLRDSTAVASSSISLIRMRLNRSGRCGLLLRTSWISCVSHTMFWPDRSWCMSVTMTR